MRLPYLTLLLPPLQIVIKVALFKLKMHFQMTGYQDLNGDRQRLYSCHVIKLNRHMRPNPRVLVLCDKHLYWLKSNYQFSNKAPVELDQITGLSLSPGSDQALVVHCVVSEYFYLATEESHK